MEDKSFLQLLYSISQMIKETADLINRFKNLFQTKEDGTLKICLKDVAKSSSAIKRFAKEVQSDFEAIINAVVIPYSNGEVEG